MTSSSMPTVTQVTAEKISDAARERRIYSGILINRPVVGEPMILFRDPDCRRMRTTDVQRILVDPDDGTLYVQTVNSTYRLCFPSL